MTIPQRVALYVAATFLAFPHPLGERVVDLGLLLAPVPPALLLFAVRGLRPARALRVGFVAGLFAHAAVLHWIYVVTVTYGPAPAWAGVLAPFGPAAYVALFSAGFAGTAALLAQRGLASPFALAAAWTALEWLRSFALTGFPWATLGYAWHANVPLLGLAPFTGVYGLSFAAALVGASALALAERRLSAKGALAGLLVALALHVGFALASRGAVAAGPRIRVAALQGNIDQGAKWSPDRFEETLEIYEELTRRAAADGAALIVWPETAVPASLAIPEVRERMQALAREVRSTLVIGAIGTDYDASGQLTAKYDSAFVITPEGELQDRYDKTHLVPFGEYLPLRPLLGRFIRAIATGATESDVSAGPRPRALDLALREGPRVRVGVPVCYELIFPDLVRRFGADRAQLLLGITNDAWYGRTGAPYQFLAITALRSAETGLWTVRAANTGVSALIDARGRVREETPIFERDWIAGDVPLRGDPGPTFYSRHGDWFAEACAIATVLALAAAIRPRKRESE